MQKETISICFTTIICALIAILTVSGCHTHTGSKQQSEVRAENRFLLQHYQKFSLHAAHKDQWRKAEFLAHKGEMAGQNSSIIPVDPTKLLKPDNQFYHDAVALYQEMQPILKDKRAKLYPEQYAAAIAHYDHYVAHAEDQKTPKAKMLTYKATFQDALYALYSAIRAMPK